MYEPLKGETKIIDGRFRRGYINMIQVTSFKLQRSGFTGGLPCVPALNSHKTKHNSDLPGRVALSVVLSLARLTQESEVRGSIPGPATYFRFSFR